MFGVLGGTWSIVSGDDDGHWQMVSNEVVPSASGAAAALGSGPYVLELASAAGARTLTIVVRSDTYTVSRRAELLDGAISPIAGSGGAGNASKLNGRTVELARWSADFALATTAAPIEFKFWYADVGQMCVVRHETPAYPCTIGPFFARSCSRIEFNGLKVTAPQRVSPSNPVGNGISLRTSNGIASDGVRLIGCGSRGPAGEPSSTVYGIGIDATSGDLTNAVIHDLELFWVHNAIFVQKAAGAVLSVAMTGRTTVRYWTGNSLRFGVNMDDGLTFSIAHLLELSPMFDIENGSIHADGFQLNSGEDIRGLVIARMTHIYADGTGSACQTFFTRNGSGPPNNDPANPSLVGVTIGKVLTTGRSIHACSVSGSDATHAFSIDRMIALTQWSGPFGGVGADYFHTPRYALDPKLNIGFVGGQQSNFTATNIFAQGGVENGPGLTLDGSVIDASFTDGDVSAHYPNASWITSPALKANALANQDAEYWNGNPDARWSADIDTVLASVLAALSGGPHAGTALDPNTW